MKLVCFLLPFFLSSCVSSQKALTNHTDHEKKPHDSQSQEISDSLSKSNIKKDDLFTSLPNVSYSGSTNKKIYSKMWPTNESKIIERYGYAEEVRRDEEQKQRRINEQMEANQRIQLSRAMESLKNQKMLDSFNKQ